MLDLSLVGKKRKRRKSIIKNAAQVCQLSTILLIRRSKVQNVNFQSCCVIEMFLHCFRWLFLYFTQFGDFFLMCINLAKIRDTVPIILTTTVTRVPFNKREMVSSCLAQVNNELHTSLGRSQLVRLTKRSVFVPKHVWSSQIKMTNFP